MLSDMMHSLDVISVIHFCCGLNADSSTHHRGSDDVLGTVPIQHGGRLIANVGGQARLDIARDRGFGEDGDYCFVVCHTMSSFADAAGGYRCRRTQRRVRSIDHCSWSPHPPCTHSSADSPRSGDPLVPQHRSHECDARSWKRAGRASD